MAAANNAAVVTTNTQGLKAVLARLKPEELDLLHTQVAKGCTDEELAYGLTVAEHLKLNIFARQIYLIKYGGNNPKMVLVIGIDGYRSVAAREQDARGYQTYAGSDPAIFGERIPDNDTVLGWHPDSATVTVYKMIGSNRVPFTQTVYWEGRARYDFNKLGDRWKADPRGMLAKCFDEETEVLTDQGFQKFSTVTGRILQVTPEGLQATDAQPFWQLYDGPMIGRFSNALDFCVTPDHDLLTQFGKVEAQAVMDKAWKYRIPMTVTGTRRDYPIEDSVIRLAGMLVADGHDNGHRLHTVAVSRPYKAAALAELGLETRRYVLLASGAEAVSSSGRVIATKSDKQGFTYPKAITKDLIGPNRSINHQTLLALSQRQARIFVDSWALFGGHTQADVTRLRTSRADHLRAFEIAAVAAGYSISIPRARQADIGGISWEITLSSKSTTPVRPNMTHRPESAPQHVPSTGKVWCVTVPSGLIVVRRRGLSMVTGQCAEVAALRAAFPSQMEPLVQRDDDVIQADYKVLDPTLIAAAKPDPDYPVGSVYTPPPPTAPAPPAVPADVAGYLDTCPVHDTVYDASKDTRSGQTYYRHKTGETKQVENKTTKKLETKPVWCYRATVLKSYLGSEITRLGIATDVAAGYVRDHLGVGIASLTDEQNLTALSLLRSFAAASPPATEPATESDTQAEHPQVPMLDDDELEALGGGEA